MTVVVCRCALLVVALFALVQAYFPVLPPPTSYFGGMRYDSSCRDSIEDLKALVEVTQSFKLDNNNYTCPTCANTFSEEIILKLVNALIFIATNKCGYGGNGGGHYPGGGNPGGVNPGGTGGGTNVKGANNSGGLIGGGNAIGILGTATAGGNTNPSGTAGGNSGVVKPSGSGGGSSTDGGNTGGGNSEKKDPLIDLSALDGNELLGLGVGGTKVLGVNVGGPSGGSNGSSKDSSANNGNKNGDALIDLGLLNTDSVANLGIGGTPVLNVAVGKQGDGGNA